MRAGACSTRGSHGSWAEGIDNLGVTTNQLRMAVPGLKLQTFRSVGGQFKVSLADLGGLEPQSPTVESRPRVCLGISLSSVSFSLLVESPPHKSGLNSRALEGKDKSKALVIHYPLTFSNSAIKRGTIIIFNILHVRLTLRKLATFSVKLLNR